MKKTQTPTYIPTAVSPLSSQRRPERTAKRSSRTSTAPNVANTAGSQKAQAAVQAETSSFEVAGRLEGGVKQAKDGAGVLYEARKCVGLRLMKASADVASRSYCEGGAHRGACWGKERMGMYASVRFASLISNDAWLQKYLVKVRTTTQDKKRMLMPHSGRIGGWISTQSKWFHVL